MPGKLLLKDCSVSKQGIESIQFRIIKTQTLYNQLFQHISNALSLINNNFIKMKNKNLYELKEVISRVNNKGNNKFKLALLLNEKMIDERIETIDKLREQSEEYKAFEQKRHELITAHAELDENGQVIVYSQPEGKGVITNDGYGYPNIVKEKKKYEKQLSSLQEDNKDVIDAEIKKQSDFAETLDQELDPAIEFSSIPFDCVPEIEYEEMKVLMPFIEK